MLKRFAYEKWRVVLAIVATAAVFIWCYQREQKIAELQSRVATLEAERLEQQRDVSTYRSRLLKSATWELRLGQKIRELDQELRDRPKKYIGPLGKLLP